MQELGAAVAGQRVDSRLAHRLDVDGLRAVAVLAILAFHLNVAGFNGGFVGVDIFFVISGYVILRSILPDLERGHFSLADFFIRRVRRLLPALIVVLAATLVAGFILLSPTELEELAGSVLATLASGANIFFFDRTGYFANAAHTRPLLHMWSLGVEEQFYIFVPLTLAALMRYRGVTAGKALAILVIASFLYGSTALALESEKHAFYMPMARFWEIAIGGCVAVAERRWGLLRKDSTWVAGAGLIVVAAAILLGSDTGGQQWVVAPVLGTAAIIAGGAANRSFVTRALASRFMVAIGHISYSIYLVHWPLIVFWRLYTARQLLPFEQVTIALLTVGLAAALSVFVETPMRAGSRRIDNRRALAGVVAAGGVIAAAGTALVLDGGAPWRLQTPAREAYASVRTADAERRTCRRDERQWLGSGFSACRWGPDSPGTDFVIWGDSHAGMLAPKLAGVFASAGHKSGVHVSASYCWPLDGVTVAGFKYSRSCPALVATVFKAMERERPKVVVIASRWGLLASDVRAPGDGTRSGHLLDSENNDAPIELGDALKRTVERVRASGAKVVVVGPVPEIDYHVPTTLVRSLHGGRQPPTVRRSDFDARQEQVLRALAKVSALEDVAVVYPHEVLCDEAICAVADGVQSLYVDDDHLSPLGVARVSVLVEAVIPRGGPQLAKSQASQRMAPGE